MLLSAIKMFGTTQCVYFVRITNRRLSTTPYLNTTDTTNTYYFMRKNFINDLIFVICFVCILKGVIQISYQRRLILVI